MQILTLNAGSSSLKFRLVATEPGAMPRQFATRLDGRVEAIGPAARLRLEHDGRRLEQRAALPDHVAAAHAALEAVLDAGLAIDAVGHRIVHGGARYRTPKRIDAAFLARLAELAALAPLHNPNGLAGIAACRERLGAKTPMVAVFDTAFHADLPPVAATYALPRALAERHAIRRYGFHGLAHGYMAARYAATTRRPLAELRLITLQLGAGCSAAAIQAGRSVDTSMGFTPLEGLVMATRSGDLDPAIIGYLAEKEGVTAAAVVDQLTTVSGLLGLAGTPVMREVLARAATDPAARLAVDLFCYRARKYVGAYLAVLGGADAVIFGGGIGEHEPEIRAGILDGMDWCGLRLDAARNAAACGREARIGTDDAACDVYVITVDEASVIAQETYRCLTHAD
jgi:acetate kinase